MAWRLLGSRVYATTMMTQTGPNGTRLLLVSDWIDVCTGVEGAFPDDTQ